LAYFAPIPGIPQIMGHTPARRFAGLVLNGARPANTISIIVRLALSMHERRVALENEVSLCLDTDLRHYAIIDKPGIVQVKRTPPDW
jgi:hypothetical protein